METSQYKRWDAKEEAIIIKYLKETLIVMNGGYKKTSAIGWRC